MEKSEFKQTLIEFYPEYYKQVTGSKKYRFKIDEKRDLQIDKFVDYVFKKINPKVLGEDFISRYLKFAFGSMTGRENPWGAKNAFPIGWIIAKTVLDKFLKAKGYEKYKAAKKLIKQGNSTVEIKSNKQKQIEKQQKDEFGTELRNHEEKEKSLFYNTEKGRVWCIDFTTLFNPKSDLCLNCKFAESCLNTLKLNFRGLYNLRIDERNI